MQLVQSPKLLYLIGRANFEAYLIYRSFNFIILKYAYQFCMGYKNFYYIFLIFFETNINYFICYIDFIIYILVKFSVMIMNILCVKNNMFLFKRVCTSLHRKQNNYGRQTGCSESDSSRIRSSMVR